MQSKHKLALVALFGITFVVASQLAAQAPAPAVGGRGGGRGGRGASGAAGVSGGPGRAGGGGGAYPSRPPADPAVAARGKALWDGNNCASCHATDLRGAAGGINLVRSQIVMDDQNGELIAKVLQNTHAKGKAAKLDLTTAQVQDLAIYMHTFMNYRTVVMPPDINSAILAAGKPAAGETYFKAKCASCHSVTGDLKGIGTKYSDPKTMQNALVAGGGGGRGGRGGGAAAGDAPSRRTVTVTVTMPSGQKYEGRLISRDSFLVTLAEADGNARTIRRNGDVPKVEVHDPMKGHADLLSVYTDDDIHNLTAYLVTVK